MLKQYSNIDEILDSDISLSAERFIPKDKALFKHPFPGRPFNWPSPLTDNSQIEFHVYSGDNWITGNHSVNVSWFTNEIFDENGINILPGVNPSLTGTPLSIDIYNQFDLLQLTSGNYRFVLNFFKNKIGDYSDQQLVIDEISPDRTEIRLRAIDEQDTRFLQEITDYINNVNQTALNNQSYKKYLLNFSRNQTAQFVNSVVFGNFLFVKLYKPLEETIEENFKCWVVCEEKLPFVDNVAITPVGAQIDYNTITGINWEASAVANTSNETALKSWNDLLGSSLQTSQEIIDSYFSGSLSGIKLNIDYSDFNNFIFYSSAVERLDNYKYKLQLIEYYTAQSASASLLSGSVSVTNAIDYNTLKTKLIGGFDHFENYLYYQSSSGLFTHDIPVVDATVAFVTGSYITPSPKSGSAPMYPYELLSISSSNFETWYNGTYDSASVYDIRNNNRLVRSVPEFILLDENNEQLTSFVNMLGHHYDILYTYINSMTKINTREEHPKIGMPNELLYSVAKQFGWSLTDGNQSKELWEYTLGTDANGIPLTGSNSVGDPSVPSRDITYTIWRRIVNNIPGLLKSKGTKRSIQALLACYGVPQSLITIKEYGGPRLSRAPLYKKYNFDYALDLISNPAGTATVDYTQPIGGLELRFRTKDVLTHFTMSNTMNLYSVGSNNVTLDYVRGTLGTISINGTASANIDCLGGEWVNTLLRTSSLGTLEIVAKKSSYGKIVATVSASAVASFPATGTVTLGSTSTGASRLEGQLQELRLYTGSLNDDPFTNHTKAPAAYDTNYDAYTELVFRTPLTQKVNHSTTSSLSGVQPNTSITISASFASWTNDTPYDSIEETYYYDGISIGAGTFDDNKIRLESNELVNTLDVYNRGSVNQFDRSPLDSNKLGVYYSPQTMINEDIIAQLGFTKLDDLIGDPTDNDPYSYPELIRTAKNYWKKYASKNDMNSYLKIFSLFDLSFFNQLDQLLPARVDKITGLLIQPNILERSKDTALTKIFYINNEYNSEIKTLDKELTGSSVQYLAAPQNFYSISGSRDSDLPSFISASINPYDATPYSYTYQIWSGSGYITASTPSWLSNPLPIVVSGSRLSEFVQYVYSGSDLRQAQFQDYLPTGIANHRYNGCKISGPGVNIDSTETPDGKPVIEVVVTDSTQIINQPPGQSGNFRIR